MAKKAGVDEYVVKRLAGHKITDVTEAVYTIRDIESVSYTHLVDYAYRVRGYDAIGSAWLVLPFTIFIFNWGKAAWEDLRGE